MSATQLIQETYRRPYPPGFSQNPGKKGQRTGKDGTRSYSDFIWALARKFTASPEEANVAAREIFADIELYGTCKPQNTEERLISLIARRLLVKYLQ